MDGKQTKEVMDKLKSTSKVILCQASEFLDKCPPAGQLLIGSAAGWVTGKVTKKVGTGVMIPVGGTVILVGAAASTGLITVDWNKFGTKVDDVAKRFEQKMPAIKTNISKYCRGNMFAVGLVGGFLIGFAR